MKYDAVMFDLDGTLLDTLEDLADSMNAALSLAGLPTHGVGAYRRFVGDGVVNLARRAAPPRLAGDEDAVARLVEAMRAQYAERWQAKTRCYDGVPELLDALASRSIPTAVLSNKPDDFTRLCVGELLGRWTFDAVRGVRDDTPRKPDAGGALAVAAGVGVPPERWLYVGDTNTDMRTAAAAGMYAVGALWGFRDAAELRASGAAVLIEHPVEVLSLLDGGG